MEIAEITGGLGTEITFSKNAELADKRPSVTVTVIVVGPFIKGIGLIVKMQFGAVPLKLKLPAFTIVGSDEVADKFAGEHKITLSTSLTLRVTGIEVLSNVDCVAIAPIVGASLIGKTVIENSDVAMLLGCKFPSSKATLI